MTLTHAVLFLQIAMPQYRFFDAERLQSVHSLDQLTGGQSIVLDEIQSVVFSCDPESVQCSVSNFEFTPAFRSRDAETLLELRGKRAHRLIQGLKHPDAALPEFSIRLGYSKSNGMDVLSCRHDPLDPEKDQCQIISYYCYFAGC